MSLIDNFTNDNDENDNPPASPSDGSSDSDWDDIQQEESIEAFKLRTSSLQSTQKALAKPPVITAVGEESGQQQAKPHKGGYADIGIEALLTGNSNSSTNSSNSSITAAVHSQASRLVDKINQELQKRGGSYLPSGGTSKDSEEAAYASGGQRKRLRAEEAFGDEEFEEANLSEFGRQVSKRLREDAEAGNMAVISRRERLLEPKEMAAARASTVGDPKMRHLPQKQQQPQSSTSSASASLSEQLEAKRQAAVAALRAELATTGRRTSLPDSDATVLSGTRIRLSRIRVSSSEWDHRMQGRRLVALATGNSGRDLAAQFEKCKTDGVQGVLVGVLVGTVQMQQKQGKQAAYSLWKLADLDRLGRQPTLGLFLFGKVHDAHWKDAVSGTAVAVLQPRVLPPRNSGSGDASVSIAVDNPQQLMLLGKAVDFGVCGRQTKSGGGGGSGKCQNPVNLAACPVCEYHAGQEYRRLSAKRSDVNSTFVGVEPRRYREQSASFPAAPSSNFAGSGGGGGGGGGPTYSGVTFLKSRSTTGGVGGASSPSAAGGSRASVAGLLQGDSPGARMLRRSLQMTTKTAAAPVASTSGAVSTTAAKKPPIQLEATSSSMNAARRVGMPDLASGTNLSFSEFAAGMSRDYRPQLGRGIVPAATSPTAAAASAASAAGASGLIVDLGSATAVTSAATLPKPTVMSVAEIARLRAARKIAAAGGLEQMQMRQQERRHAEIATRLEQLQQSTTTAINTTPTSHTNVPTAASSVPSQNRLPPPARRHKLLGDVDVDSPEFRRLMSQTSAYSDLAAERQVSEQDGYFNTLERKEQLEEKLATVMERQVRVAECEECGLQRMQTLTERCKREGHRVTWATAIKRPFKCKDCNLTTYTIDSRYPTDPCRQCGGHSFEKTSFSTQRKGPTLERDVLLTRGEERKFVNQ